MIPGEKKFGGTLIQKKKTVAGKRLNLPSQYEAVNAERVIPGQVHEDRTSGKVHLNGENASGGEKKNELCFGR